MFSICANPDCKKRFDYREGHFFRFHKAHPAGEAPPNTHSVQHFWLCGKCSEEYTLKYDDVRGVVMTLHRMVLSGEQDSRRFVAVA
jgi:hypothetical protein